MDPNAKNTRIYAGTCSAISCSIIACPFDNMKVRMLFMQKNEKTGLYPYKNIRDAFS